MCAEHDVVVLVKIQGCCTVCEITKCVISI